MIKKISFFTFFIFALSLTAFSQEQKNNSPSERSYRSVTLLDSYDEVLEKLKADSLILVDPNSDFGDFDEDTPDLIKAKVPFYINHLYYQFFKGKLFALSLFFNTKKFSYLEMYREMKEKYGKPKSYNAQQALWETEKTLIILDKLPSLKYIDKESFNLIRENNKRYLFRRDIVREKILEGL